MSKADMLIEEWQLPPRGRGREGTPPRLQIWRRSTQFAVYIVYNEGTDDYGFKTLDQAMEFAEGWMEGYSWNTGTRGYPSRIS